MNECKNECASQEQRSCYIADGAEKVNLSETSGASSTFMNVPNSRSRVLQIVF